MMLATITAQDGTSDTTEPVVFARLDASVDSGNIVHALIDGAIAATLIGDRPASGDMTLVYATDAAATAARELLARPTSFLLDVPSRPALGMTFIRAGALRPVVHDGVRHVWEFKVGFQEVIA